MNGFKKLSTIKLRAYVTYTKFVLEKLFMVHELTNCSIDLIANYEKHKVFFSYLCQQFFDL
jgi:hypothetical protein